MNASFHFFQVKKSFSQLVNGFTVTRIGILANFSSSRLEVVGSKLAVLCGTAVAVWSASISMNENNKSIRRLDVIIR